MVMNKQAHQDRDGRGARRAGARGIGL